MTLNERRFPPRPDFGARGVSTWVRANYFEVQLPRTVIFLYEVSFVPEIRIRGLKERVLELLRKHPNLVAFEKHVATDGSKFIVSTKKLNPSSLETSAGRNDDRLTIEIIDNEVKAGKKYKVKIQRVAEIFPTDLTDYVQGTRPDYDPAQATQALNILAAKFPRDQPNMVPIGGNRFFIIDNRSDLMIDLGGGVVARKGFYSSIRPTIDRMLCNVNVCTKAFIKPGPLVDLIFEYLGINPRSQFPPRDRLRGLPNFLKGLKVSFTYRNNGKTNFKTIESLLNKKPNECILERTDMKTGLTSTINVAQFFKDVYNVNLTYPHFPAVKLLNDRTSMIVPAEVLTVVDGQHCKDDKMSSDQVGKMISAACRKPPENADMITGVGLPSLGFKGNDGYLKDFDMKVSNQMVVVPARTLPGPTVSYANNKRMQPGPSWNLRDTRFSTAGDMQSWTAFIVEDPRYPIPRDAAKNAIDGFESSCRATGVRVAPCNMSFCDAARFNFDDIMNDPRQMEAAGVLIKQKFDKLAGKVSIVLVILDLKQHKAFGPVYAAVKYAGDVKCGVATVCCQWGRFRDGGPQYWSNVALKFNFKLGGTNHLVSTDQLGFLKNGKTMLVGCDVTHASPKSRRGTPSIAGVVASCDGTYATYPASLRLQGHRTEMIADLKEMLIERLKFWNQKSKNKSWPECVMVYRDGVSEGEFHRVLDFELPKIKQAFKECGAGPQYNPKLTITIVGKRHHTRFYPTDQAQADHDNGNPMNGTVVDRGITSVYDFDFFLQAHKGLKGTARPAHYYVIYNEIGVKSDELQGLTHNLCYLFARATKSVSIIPPAYYADILCERGRCYINGLYNTVEGNTSGKTKASDEEKEQTMREALALWGEGVHQRVKNSMFYL
ncbi:ribonuclease H-like domain-containing protein [Trichophaea hybrida]|nr:ribonuclease H-like domain-containing protein [Trichophaea hybrida]